MEVATRAGGEGVTSARDDAEAGAVVAFTSTRTRDGGGRKGAPESDDAEVTAGEADVTAGEAEVTADEAESTAEEAEVTAVEAEITAKEAPASPSPSTISAIVGTPKISRNNS